MWNSGNSLRYPSIIKAILLAAFFIICQLIAAYLVGMLAGITGTVISSIALGIVNSLALLAVMRWVSSKTGITLVDAIGGRRVSLWVTVSVLLVSLGAVVLLNELQMVLQKYIPMPESFKLSRLQFLNAKDWFGAMLTLSIVAPITEEILFRGVILSGFLRNYRKTEALMLSAWLFAFIHLNPWQYVTAFLIGLFLGFAYMRTNSVIAPILCHAAFNGCSFIWGSRFSDLDFIGAYFRLIPLNVGAFAVVIVGVMLLIRSTRRRY